jgi:hypothetical protein
MLLIALYTVRSERQFCEQLDYNLMFRWFLDMDMEEPSFDPTVFTKNRDRLVASDAAGEFFRAVVAQAQGAGLMSREHFSVDGTLIEAWASLRSRPLFAKLLTWGRRHRRSFEPKSGMGRAIRYLLRNFRALGCFLRYATIPPDNNVAEAGLRRVALGRSNFLFVGHEESGHDLAVLYTLVASCEKKGVNPIEYLTDVLMRVQTHPAHRIEELLPHRWKPP